MKLKKNSKADLDKWRWVFLLIGYYLSLTLVIVVLNSTTTNASFGNSLGDLDMAELDEEDIEITRPEELKPPPPPEPPPEAPEEIEIKENEEELENEAEVADSETDQEEMIEIEEEEFLEPFISVERMPMLGDCEDEDCTQAAIMNFIAKNFRYPEIAKANGIEGRVILTFVVEVTGKVGRVKILKGLDKYIDKAAIEVIESLPVFTPGRQSLQEPAVPVKYTVPIKCSLG